MSSTYAVLCLSHDPAVIAADGDWNRAEKAEAAIAQGITGHEHCDLMITRYSGSLVELGCPSSWPKRVGGAGQCIHRDTQWADIAWIRLLLVAQREAAGTAVRGKADAAGVRCWTRGRIERLRVELGIDGPAEPAPASPPPCSINHDCPGQPRPGPLTARGEARCQSRHRRGDGPLVQCAKAVHPKDEVHTDYDQDMFWPPRVESAGLPWLVWSGA